MDELQACDAAAEERLPHVDALNVLQAVLAALASSDERPSIVSVAALKSSSDARGAGNVCVMPL